MVKETTEKCHVVIQHLLSISNLPTKLLKLRVKNVFLITSIASSPSYLENEIMLVLLYILQINLKGKMGCLPQNMQHFCSCPGLVRWYCFVNKLGRGRKTPKKANTDAETINLETCHFFWLQTHQIQLK